MEVDPSVREEPLDGAAECVLTEIRRRLCSTNYPSLREVHCEFSGGVVVLRGRVSRYFYKQLAQAVLLTEPAVWMVVNKIEVSENGHLASGISELTRFGGGQSAPHRPK